MGNKNEKLRIENEHEEEINKMKAIDDENDRQAALKRFAEENKLKLSLEEIERYSRKDRMKHEEIMDELSTKKEVMILEKNNERKKDEEYHERKMAEINNGHLKQMKNLSIQRENNQMENNRKLKEMKLKDENEKMKINNSQE